MRAWWVSVVLAGCGRTNFADVTRVLELSAHGEHACAVLANGSLWCWGDGSRGQLGTGSLVVAQSQTQVPGLPAMRSVSTGEFSTVAVDDGGRLWGFGVNDNGELGLGVQTLGEPVPRQLGLDNVVQMAAGQSHTCVLRADGSVWCTGRNSCGQLATDTGGVDRPAWDLVQGIPAARAIGSDDDSVCIIDMTNSLACWGSMNGGTIPCPGPVLPPTGIPIGEVVQVEGGCHQTQCAVDASGAVWCWGANYAGQLGDATFTASAQPVRVPGFGGGAPRVLEVGVGASSVCARTETERVFCWGANDYGQLGIGDSSVAMSASPIELPAFDGSLPIDNLEVSCGGACVVSGDDVYCWGRNAALQVGDGSLVDRFMPVKIKIYDGP